ncbi:hypothetical protein FSOLCH5_013461 [Fusarium solani]
MCYDTKRTMLGTVLYQVGKHAQKAKRDRSNENFKKKWSTLKKNGLNIHQTYDAEVYICIRRRGEKYEFKSTEKALPLSDEEKVRMYLGDIGGLLLTEHGRTKASRCQCS